MKQGINSLCEKLGQILKAGTCYTHDQIAAMLGITGDYLSYILRGYTFTGRTLSEDDEIETFVHWSGLGLIIKKQGCIEITSRNTPVEPSEKALIKYPPGERPLCRGLHKGAIK
jgi:hypothetical protein